MTDRRKTVLAALLLGAATLLVGSGAWVRAATSSAVDPEVALAVPGGVLAPSVTAGGLVVLAAGAALALVGRRGRWVAAAALALGGALVGSGALGAVGDPTTPALSAARREVGVAVLDGPASATALPWLALFLGSATVALAVVVAVRGARWPGPSARHTTAPPDGESAWDALSKGDDPS